jgi:hypothetical protein
MATDCDYTQTESEDFGYWPWIHDFEGRVRRDDDISDGSCVTLRFERVTSRARHLRDVFVVSVLNASGHRISWFYLRQPSGEQADFIQYFSGRRTHGGIYVPSLVRQQMEVQYSHERQQLYVRQITTTSYVWLRFDVPDYFWTQELFVGFTMETIHTGHYAHYTDLSPPPFRGDGDEEEQPLQAFGGDGEQ